jgi:hypothetical protein
MTKYFVLILVLFSVLANAQVTSELSPKILILLSLSAVQQNRLPLQQSGNVVYNLDENRLAITEGAQWNNISGIDNSSSNQYKNHKLFTGTATFTVTPVINNIIIEVWGNSQIMTTVSPGVPGNGCEGVHYEQVLSLFNSSSAFLIEGKFPWGGGSFGHHRAALGLGD